MMIRLYDVKENNDDNKIVKHLGVDADINSSIYASILDYLKQKYLLHTTIPPR